MRLVSTNKQALKTNVDIPIDEQIQAQLKKNEMWVDPSELNNLSANAHAEEVLIAYAKKIV